MADPLTTIRIALATGEGVDEAFGACDALEAERLTLAAIADAAAMYVGHTGEHYWRCEYRTAAKGWKKGDPPVIECVCGLDDLVAQLERRAGD